MPCLMRITFDFVEIPLSLSHARWHRSLPARPWYGLCVVHFFMSRAFLPLWAPPTCPFAPWWMDSAWLKLPAMRDPNEFVRVMIVWWFDPDLCPVCGYYCVVDFLSSTSKKRSEESLPRFYRLALFLPLTAFLGGHCIVPGYAIRNSEPDGQFSLSRSWYSSGRRIWNCSSYAWR